MIALKDYADVFKELTDQYFISGIEYVGDLRSWARKNDIHLNEPDQPMKLVSDDEKLSLVAQSFISEKELDNVIRALGVRWSLIDNVLDIDKALNSVKKRLAYCFLKEYSRTIRTFEGDDLKEDEWTMNSLEKLDFFKE